MIVSGHEAFFEVMKISWTYIEVMAVQLCDYN